MIEPGSANSTEKSIARAIVALAKSLGLNVVAEGVETRAQLDFILEAGADLVQGFLFSEPLSVTDIEPLLKTGFIDVNAPVALSA
jgi:EAL domain-containing protein (putative c-di-GMP-specific phosphodiesterase class I)